MKAFVLCILAILWYSSAYASPGDLLWKYKTSSYINRSTVTNGNLIFFSCQDSTLTALDRNTRVIKWQYKGDYAYGSPFVYKDMVFHVGYHDGILHTFKAETGEILWEYDLGETNFYNAPLIKDDVLYISGTYPINHLLALKTKNGELKWDCRSFSNYVTSSIENGILYYTDGSLEARVAESGEFLWKIFFFTMASSLENSILYSDNFEQNIPAGAFRVTDKVYIWKNYDFPYYIPSYRPTIYSGNVYFYPLAPEIAFYCLDKNNGNLKWVYSDNQHNFSPPSLADSTVYFGSQDSCLYAFHYETGKLRWKFRADRFIRYTPCVKDGIVYFSDFDYLYAVEGERTTGFKKVQESSQLPVSQFKAYPNPFRDNLTVSLPVDSRIYSLTGQLIINIKKGKQVIDTGKWKEGVYIIKAGDEAKRLIKIR